MPGCTHFKCKREALPHAVGFPYVVPAACAHVNPKGEPCPESPQPDYYDDESHRLIVTDRVLWDPEIWPADSDVGTAQAPEATEPSFSTSESPAASETLMAPMDRAAAAFGVDLSSGHSVDGDQAATETTPNASTVGSDGDPILAGSNPAPGTVTPAKKKPAKTTRKKRVEKKASARPADADDEVDDWDP